MLYESRASPRLLDRRLRALVILLRVRAVVLLRLLVRLPLPHVQAAEILANVKRGQQVVTELTDVHTELGEQTVRYSASST